MAQQDELEGKRADDQGGEGDDTEGFGIHKGLNRTEDQSGEEDDTAGYGLPRAVKKRPDDEEPDGRIALP